LSESVSEGVWKKVNLEISDVDLGVGLLVLLLLSLLLRLVDGDVHWGPTLKGVGFVKLINSFLSHLWGLEVGETVRFLEVRVHGHNE
jgi:hypothetical protein